jgi:hypothetical protein
MPKAYRLSLNNALIRIERHMNSISSAIKMAAELCRLNDKYFADLFLARSRVFQ